MKVKVGDRIRIIEMKNEPSYNGKDGIVEHIDDIGQIHGSWGGCALIPGVDKFEEVKICGICANDIIGYGNNSDPINCGLVCDDCNINYVLPLRIFLSGYVNDNKVLVLNTNFELDIVNIDINNTLDDLQKIVDGLIEIYPKEDDKFLYIVDEEGICKNKEYNALAKCIFDIDVVGDLVVCKKEMLKWNKKTSDCLGQKLFSLYTIK